MAIKHDKLTKEQWETIRFIPLDQTREIVKVWHAEDGTHLEIVMRPNE